MEIFKVLKWKICKLYSVLVNKFKDVIAKLFGIDRGAYPFTVKHRAKNNIIIVSVWDLQYDKQHITSRNCDNHPWWTSDMISFSWLDITEPTPDEIKEGITLENKIKAAYIELQIIANHLNEELKQNREQRERIKKVADKCKI